MYSSVALVHSHCCVIINNSHLCAELLPIHNKLGPWLAPGRGAERQAWGQKGDPPLTCMYTLLYLFDFQTVCMYDLLKKI